MPMSARTARLWIVCYYQPTVRQRLVIFSHMDEKYHHDATHAVCLYLQKSGRKGGEKMARKLNPFLTSDSRSFSPLDFFANENFWLEGTAKRFVQLSCTKLLTSSLSRSYCQASAVLHTPSTARIIHTGSGIRTPAF